MYEGSRRPPAFIGMRPVSMFMYVSRICPVLYLPFCIYLSAMNILILTYNIYLLCLKCVAWWGCQMNLFRFRTIISVKNYLSWYLQCVIYSAGIYLWIPSFSSDLAQSKSNVRLDSCFASLNIGNIGKSWVKLICGTE